MAARGAPSTRTRSRFTRRASDSSTSKTGGLPSTNSERDNARVYEIQCTDDVRSAISRAVIQAGHDLIKLDYGHGDLERTFLELVKGGSADAND